MTKIFTTSATNDGFYVVLATVAADAGAARAAFTADSMMQAPADEGGDYTLGEIVERVVEEDDYCDLGTTRLVDPALIVASLIASPGSIEMIESGGNG